MQLRFWRDSRSSIVALLLLVLVGLIVCFGRELGELTYIGAARARDKVEEAVAAPALARDYEEVVQANTEQTVEIERYLAELRHPSGQTLESLGLDFSSEAAYAHSRERLRSLLAASLSYPPPQTLPIGEAPSMVRLAEDELAIYYELSVPVLKEVHARGVFMMPRTVSGKVPLIIAAYGRGGMPARARSGKLTLVGRNNRDLALGALKNGYAVWQPILVFYARERPTDIRERLEVRAREAGTTLPAIEIAKIIGGLDAIVRTQQVDPARIAMVGMSYGGFYTLCTAALDDRIRVAVVAAYVNDREAILDSTEPFGMPDWRFPNSLSIFHDANMAALICPRPLQIQAGNHDQLFPIAGVRKTVPAVRSLYARLDIGERFSFLEFVGRHDFNGEAAWQFVDRFFNKENGPRQ